MNRKPADVIFIPGGPCGEIALHAAELFHQGYAPLLIPSGCHSILDPVYRGARSPEKYRGREFPTEADFFSCHSYGKGRPGRKHPAERQASLHLRKRYLYKEAHRRPWSHDSDRPSLLPGLSRPPGPPLLPGPFPGDPDPGYTHRHPGNPGVRTGLDGRKPSIWSFRRWSTAAASSTKS